MKIADVRKRVQKLGIKPSNMKKDEMIRTIQRVEGNFPCYRTETDYCDQHGCVWRDDCLPAHVRKN